MKTLQLLYKKNYMVFSNRFLSSPKKIAQLILLILLLLTVFIGGSYLIANKLFDPLSSEELVNAKPIMQTMLFIFMLMFSVFQFFTSAISIVPDFYESPDMTYLISTPIKANILLLYKLINHSFTVIKKESLIAFPMMIATGLYTQASPIFYVVLPIVYFFLVSASACFGIILGMVLLNRMTIKRYKTLMLIGQNLFTLLIWLLFVFKWIDTSQLMGLLDLPLIKNFLIYWLPAYTASHIVADLTFGLSSNFLVNAFAFTGIVSVMVLSVSMTANRFFFSGWMRNTAVVISKKQKHSKKTPSLTSTNNTNKSAKNRHPMLCLIQHQWLSSVKNIELLLPALMIYLVYFGSVYGFIHFKTVPLDLRGIALIIMGFMFVSLGTSLPLMSSEILKNPKLEKQQYALFKTFPLSPKQYMYFRLLAQGIPTITIISLGMTIACILSGVSLHNTLILLAIQAVLYVGYLIQGTSFLTLYYQRFYDTNKFIGNLLSMCLSLIYYTLTFGLYIFNEIEWISFPLYAIIIVATLYASIQFFVLFPLGARAWARTEF